MALNQHVLIVDEDDVAVDFSFSGVASGAPDSGNSLKIGGVARDVASPVLVDAGDRTDAWFTKSGALHVCQGSANSIDAAGGNAAIYPRSDSGSYAPIAYQAYGYDGSVSVPMRADANGAVVQSCLAAASWAYSGVTGGITDTNNVEIAAAGAAGVRNYCHGIQYFNSAAVASEIVIKDGATIIWRGFAPASMTVPVSVRFDPPLRGTAATAMNVVMITTATATRVSAQGHTGA